VAGAQHGQLRRVRGGHAAIAEEVLEDVGGGLDRARREAERRGHRGGAGAIENLDGSQDRFCRRDVGDQAEGLALVGVDGERRADKRRRQQCEGTFLPLGSALREHGDNDDGGD